MNFLSTGNTKNLETRIQNFRKFVRVALENVGLVLTTRALSQQHLVATNNSTHLQVG